MPTYNWSRVWDSTQKMVKMCINVVLYGASNIFAFIHCINRYLLILDYGRKLKGISNIMQCVYRGKNLLQMRKLKRF
jgi:hypothetical protein